MNTVVKKKIKIRKKNFAIFLTIVFLFFFSIFKTISFVAQKINRKEKEETIIEKKVIEKEPEKKIIEESDEEKKLNMLNHMDNEIDYFNYDYLDRYIEYKNENQNLGNEQIIKNVNMQLDKKHYQDIIPAKNLNTEKILVNKYYYLDKNYIPDNLETISVQYALSNMKLVSYAKAAFEKLSKDAAKEKLTIIAMSSYRSYNYQVNLWEKYAKQDGEEKADTYSGRAGHSEHQTGLAVDVYNEKENYTNFENTKEFDWMQEHAHEYGFILRFPKDKENETGYQYESWHYRYVGVEAATYIKEHNISFEEYYATIIKDW